LNGVPASKGGAAVQFSEIVSPSFTLRIRVGVGPWTERETTSLVAGLVPTEKPLDKWDEIHGEVGVYVIAGYYGASVEHRKILSRRDFELEAEQSASFANRYCKPFLLGQSEDFEKIRQKLEETIHEEQARIKKLLDNLPPNVKPMWKREGESHVEWTQRLEAERKAWEARRSDKSSNSDY
jgi:hypothetical protein